MARGLYLAAYPHNGCDPNPRVGCVIEKDGEIVGEAWHHRAGEAHAEVLALQQAGSMAKSATVYVTLEPCCHSGRTGPCTEALIAAGVDRVVVAMEDPNPSVAGGGLAALRAAGVIVTTGLMTAEAELLNRGFISRIGRGRPFVCTKIAASLDGRTALANGQSQWITSTESRADVQQVRARVSAILTGAGTVAIDDPRMTVRLDRDERWQPPLRIILDSTLRIAPTAKILRHDAPTLIFTADDAAEERVAALRDAGATIERVTRTGDGLDLAEVMKKLADQQINEVLVEAGPTLNGALLQANLIDELLLYQAPHLLGADARPMFEFPALSAMDQRPQFKLLATRRIADDTRMRLVPIGRQQR